MHTRVAPSNLLDIEGMRSIFIVAPLVLSFRVSISALYSDTSNDSSALSSFSLSFVDREKLSCRLDS